VNESTKNVLHLQKIVRSNGESVQLMSQKRTRITCCVVKCQMVLNKNTYFFSMIKIHVECSNRLNRVVGVGIAKS
jgi:hypothetical protein